MLALHSFECLVSLRVHLGLRKSYRVNCSVGLARVLSLCRLLMSKEAQGGRKVTEVSWLHGAFVADFSASFTLVADHRKLPERDELWDDPEDSNHE